MPYRVLRVAMLRAVQQCCGPDEAERVVDHLLTSGVRPPVLTITDAADLPLIPDGSAVVVGDLRDGARVGCKQPDCIAFAGEDEAYPFAREGLAPPLPCTVVWVPREGRDHFHRLYAQRTAQVMGLDAAAVLAALDSGDR